jgi:hypothetical protein
VLRGVHVWRLNHSWENCPPDPLTHVETATDAAGDYRLPSLQPGTYRVEVVANGLSYDRRMEVGIADGAEATLVHELVPSGVLQVAALDTSDLGVVADGASDPTMLAGAGGEHITFPGLAPGHYKVVSYLDVKVEPLVLGTAEVVAGRTTWLDLRAATIGAVVSGRITSNGQPLAGVKVSLYPAEARTDEIGAFRLLLAHPVHLACGSFPSPDPRLQLSYGGFTALWSDENDQARSTIDAAIELGGRFVEFTALDAGGNPVPVQVGLHGNRPDGDGPGVAELSGTPELPAGTAHLGPLPPWPIQGWATFTGGLVMRFTIAPDTTMVRLQSPATATTVLHVVVRRGHDRLPGAPLCAHRWTGEAPPPAGDGDFRAHSEGYDLQVGDDGSADFLLPPGDYLVSSNNGVGSHAPAKRVHLDLGVSGQVAIETK